MLRHFVTQEHIAKIVSNGINWLDNNHKGWREKVSANILDMSSPYCSLLGQLFANLHENTQVNKVFHILGRNFCLEHGFEVENPANYHILTEEWKRRLRPIFNLSEDKVRPGVYIIDKVNLSRPQKHILPGAIVIVFEQAEGLEPKKNYCYIEGDYVLLADVNVDVYEYKRSPKNT